MPALNPNEYAYLWSPTRQMLDKNGKPLVGGYVMLDQHGTPGVEALSYSDWNGTLNARRILLDSLGRASAIVENDKIYDMYVYNRFNVLTWSALGVNCAGEGGSGPLRFTSSDGSIIITRTSNIVDLKVSHDEKIFGSAEADSVDGNGLIEFDNVSSGDITVVSAGTIRIGAGKLYHVTVALEFSTSTVNPLYCDCQLVDSENTVHKFTLDASRTKQMVELSWDAVSTSDTFQLYIQAPSIFTVTSAELYIHSVNPVVGGSTPQMQSDWDVTDIDSPAYIKNKPDISEYARLADLAAVAFSGDYNDLANKPNLSVFARSADLATVATTGSYNDLTNIPAHLVQDADYVHTDNNFTDAEKTKLSGIEAGAEVNVQADWNQSDDSADDYIKNKPVFGSNSVVTVVYGISTYAEVNAALTNNQAIIFKESAGDTEPKVPVSVYKDSHGYVHIDCIKYTGNSIFKNSYQVTLQSVWSYSSAYMHRDEVLTITYGDSLDLSTLSKLQTYIEEGLAIVLKIGSSIPLKFLPFYGVESPWTLTFRDIQTSQDGKKLQAIDYKINRSTGVWSTTTTDLFEIQPGTVVLTTSNTADDIQTALTNGAVPLLKVGNYYFQMTRAYAYSSSYSYTFTRVNQDSSPYVYVISNTVSSGVPNTSGAWEVHDELLMQVNWSQSDSTKPDYIKNKPNPVSLVAGTGISLVEVDSTLIISYTGGGGGGGGAVDDVTVNGSSVVDANHVAVIDLTPYALASALAAVATSGAYSDLSGTPDLSVYALISSLAAVATSGDYTDLSNKPDLSVYALASALATVATSGSYADLSNKPDLSVYALASSLAAVATSGDYNDLSNKPTIPTITYTTSQEITDILADLT